MYQAASQFSGFIVMTGPPRDHIYVLVLEKKWFHLMPAVQHMGQTHGCTRSDVIWSQPCSLSQEENLTSVQVTVYDIGLDYLQRNG